MGYRFNIGSRTSEDRVSIKSGISPFLKKNVMITAVIPTGCAAAASVALLTSVVKEKIRFFFILSTKYAIFIVKTYTICRQLILHLHIHAYKYNSSNIHLIFSITKFTSIIVCMQGENISCIVYLPRVYYNYLQATKQYKLQLQATYYRNM